MIVVDTTVWIDFLEGRGTIFERHLAELLESDAPIALVDIVYCEILQGVRDEESYRLTRASLRAHPILRPRGLETFETATNLYRTGRQRGLTIRRSVDCLIAATCLENDAEIYHNDRDFDALARVSDLTIHRPA
jgi:predicted nucleic acid-binding protein